MVAQIELKSKADLSTTVLDVSYDLYPALPPNLDDEGTQGNGQGVAGGENRDLSYLDVNGTYSCLLFDCGLEYSRSSPNKGATEAGEGGFKKKRSSTATFFDEPVP